MSYKDEKLEELKLKLKSVTKLKLKNERNEHCLRSNESMIAQEIILIKAETNYTSQQLENIGREISQMKYHIAMIDICSASENAKIESHLTGFNSHMNSFDALFSKERELWDIQNNEYTEKETKKEELERQKLKKILELNEQKAKEAAAIEKECEAIERECFVLRKRNKAIMLKLRRNLINAEEKRRNLINK